MLVQILAAPGSYFKIVHCCQHTIPRGSILPQNVPHAAMQIYISFIPLATLRMSHQKETKSKSDFYGNMMIKQFT